MNEINLKRKESEILNLIANIVAFDLNNVNISDVVVMDVKLSNDLSHVKVFVVVESNVQKTLIALNNSAPAVKKILSKTLTWRKVPTVTFVLDAHTAQTEKIEKILQEIKND